jgi:hypothetical protein
VLRLAYEAGAVDAYGNDAGGFAGPVELTGYGFDPGSTSEPRLPGQDRVIVEPTLYGPFSMPFKPQDQVVVRGVTYEVEGVVRQWRNMFSNREAGAVVSLRRVDG